jgi:hypothetical protein
MTNVPEKMSPTQLQIMGSCGHTVQMNIAGVSVSFSCEHSWAPVLPSSDAPKPLDSGTSIDVTDLSSGNKAFVRFATQELDASLFASDPIRKEPLVVQIPFGTLDINPKDHLEALQRARSERRPVQFRIDDDEL